VPGIGQLGYELLKIRVLGKGNANANALTGLAKNLRELNLELSGASVKLGVGYVWCASCSHPGVDPFSGRKIP
jgi:hypothetical protein